MSSQTGWLHQGDSQNWRCVVKINRAKYHFDYFHSSMTLTEGQSYENKYKAVKLDGVYHHHVGFQGLCYGTHDNRCLLWYT